MSSDQDTTRDTDEPSFPEGEGVAEDGASAEEETSATVNPSQAKVPPDAAEASGPPEPDGVAAPEGELEGRDSAAEQESEAQAEASDAGPNDRSSARADDEESPHDLAEIEALLGDSDEQRRMRGLLAIRELAEVSPETIALLRAASSDPSRSVRTLAHDILKDNGQDLDSQQAAREKVARQAAKGAGFLAMISLGSAGTGLIATGLSMVSYYTMGRFPFPEPLTVLFWLNTILTLPFVIVGALVLLPGRGPRIVAGVWAGVALVASLAAMVFLQELYMEHWSYQFTLERQRAYVAFLSPFRVAFMLLPVVLGQSIMLYYVSSRRLQRSE